VRELLRKTLPAKLSYSDEEKKRNMFNYLDGNKPQTYSHFLNRLADSIIASLVAVDCGVSLIVPMAIKALNPPLTKSLITTSVLVVVFGFTLGF